MESEGNLVIKMEPIKEGQDAATPSRNRVTTPQRSSTKHFNGGGTSRSRSPTRIRRSPSPRRLVARLNSRPNREKEGMANDYQTVKLLPPAHSRLKNIQDMSGFFQACQLRRHIRESKVENGRDRKAGIALLNSLHSPVRFNTTEFLKAFVYEFVPTLPFSFLAALLLEGDCSRAYHLSGYRGYLPLYDHGGAIGLWEFFMIGFIEITLTASLVMWFVLPHHLVKGIDIWELILAYAWMLVRIVIVSLKYGFFRPEEQEAMRHPPPMWTDSHTVSRLLLMTWLNPSPGMLDDLLAIAMQEANVELGAVNVELNSHEAARHLFDEYIRVDGGRSQSPHTDVAEVGSKGDRSVASSGRPGLRHRSSSALKPLWSPTYDLVREAETTRGFDVTSLNFGPQQVRSPRLLTKQRSSTAAPRLVPAADQPSSPPHSSAQHEQQGKDDDGPGSAHSSTRDIDAIFLENLQEGEEDLEPALLSTAILAHCIVQRTFTCDLHNFVNRVTMLLTLGICCLPAAIRALYDGVPLFGSTLMEVMVFVAAFGGTYQGASSTLAFGMTAFLDLHRRKKAMDLIERLVTYPGVPLSYFSTTDSQQHSLAGVDPISPVLGGNAGSWRDGKRAVLYPGRDEDEGPYIYIDLQVQRNAFAWMLLRKTVRRVGDSFHRRVLSYVGVLVAWAILAAATLVVMVYSQVRYHVASLAVIGGGMILVSVIVLSAVSEAKSLQKRVRRHRMVLKNERMLIDEQLFETKQIMHQAMLNKAVRLNNPTRFERLEFELEELRVLSQTLVAIDEAIGFEEEELDPIKILQTPANAGVIGTCAALIAGLLGLAIEGYSASPGIIDGAGWYHPE